MPALPLPDLCNLDSDDVVEGAMTVPGEVFKSLDGDTNGASAGPDPAATSDVDVVANGGGGSGV